MYINLDRTDIPPTKKSKLPFFVKVDIKTRGLETIDSFVASYQLIS